MGEYNQYLKKVNAEEIDLVGLGADKATKGLRTYQNSIFINQDLKDLNHEIILIQDIEFSLFHRFGIKINGIIGFEFFKNYPIEIDYIRQKIIVHQNKINPKKLRKHQEIPISFFMSKPYIDINLTNESQSFEEQKFLIDTGNTDGLWIFEQEIKGYALDQDFFEDVIGNGFNGIVLGKRTKIKNLEVANFILKNPLISIPHPQSIENINLNNGRKGSIGNEIWRRFHLVYDYPNRKIFMRRNKHFSDDFNYNLSGIELVQNEATWEKERQENLSNKLESTPSSNTTQVYNTVNYIYKLKPIYRIHSIRKKSNAEKIGLKVGDEVYKINKKKVRDLNLEEVENQFKRYENHFVDLEIIRNGQHLKFRLILEYPKL